MRNMRFLNIAAGVGLLVNVACAGDDSSRPTYPSWTNTLLVESQTHAPNFASLVEAGAPDVTELLDSDTVLTAFAPASVGEASADTEGLGGILRYHLVGTKLNGPNLRDGARLMTLAGATIRVNVASEGALSVSDLNCNTINVTNPTGSDAFGNDYGNGVHASNGILHVIGGLLTPPAMTTSDYLGTDDVPLQDVPATLDGVGGFFTLLQTVGDQSLTGALEASGQRTIFAPNEEAFGAVDLLDVSGDVITNILLYHVSDGITTSCELGDSIMTQANITADIETMGSTTTVGGAIVGARLDIEGNNGVAHELDTLMIPPTLVEVAGATDIVSSVVGAVTSSPAADVFAALQPDTLGGDDPVTLFAPTNDALAATGTIAAGDLVGVLQHHAIASQQVFAALTTIETMTDDMGTPDDPADDRTIPVPNEVTTLNGTLTITLETDDDGFLPQDEDGDDVSTRLLIDGAGNTILVDGDEGDPDDETDDIAPLFAATDIRTLTGVIHVINYVLFP